MSGMTLRPSGGDAVIVRSADDSRDDVRWFRDEVAIDFPSMASAVDRIRNAFVAAERSTPLTASLRLSWHEARRGATMPLDIPVCRVCRTCGGRGESWAEMCVRCAGTGAEMGRHQVHVSVPAGVPDGALFRFTVTPRHHPATRIELQIHVE
jgi:DnaJ-class molecular chaperone